MWGGGGGESFYQVVQCLALNQTAPVNNQRASRTVEEEGVNQMMSILNIDNITFKLKET